MDFARWEPIYEEILKDFGWRRKNDEEAAGLLSKLLHRKRTDLTVLKNKIHGKDILVCGKAPSLSNELDRIDNKKFVIISADGATSILLKKGIIPDIIVTDLDGNIPDEVEANRKGAFLVVHAHGDNMDKLGIVADLKNVIGTTQSTPLSNVYNFGGFSDGDRCVFLAHEFGARSITIAGFDFDDPNVSEIKKKKLKWARKLIRIFPGILNFH